MPVVGLGYAMPGVAPVYRRPLRIAVLAWFMIVVGVMAVVVGLWMSKDMRRARARLVAPAVAAVTPAAPVTPPPVVAPTPKKQLTGEVLGPAGLPAADRGAVLSKISVPLLVDRREMLERLLAEAGMLVIGDASPQAFQFTSVEQRETGPEGSGRLGTLVLTTPSGAIDLGSIAATFIAARGGRHSVVHDQYQGPGLSPVLGSLVIDRELRRMETLYADKPPLTAEQAGAVVDWLRQQTLLRTAGIDSQQRTTYFRLAHPLTRGEFATPPGTAVWRFEISTLRGSINVDFAPDGSVAVPPPRQPAQITNVPPPIYPWPAWLASSLDTLDITAALLAAVLAILAAMLLLDAPHARRLLIGWCLVRIALTALTFTLTLYGNELIVREFSNRPLAPKLPTSSSMWFGIVIKAMAHVGFLAAIYFTLTSRDVRVHDESVSQDVRILPVSWGAALARLVDSMGWRVVTIVISSAIAVVCFLTAILPGDHEPLLSGAGFAMSLVAVIVMLLSGAPRIRTEVAR